MSTRTPLAISLVCAALAACVAWFGLRAARATSAYAGDVAQLERLVAARAALQTSVLEARAGLQLNFDDINAVILSLRAAAGAAAAIRTRGPAYARAADELARTAEALRAEESALETFKTDLALLRLSARYFPLAAAALTRVSGARSRRTETGELVARFPAAENAALAGLRTDVESYQEVPTRELAQRLEARIAKLSTLQAKLDQDDPDRAELSVLLGHSRVILDRRERVDRYTRSLVRSPVREHIEAARAAYEHAARRQISTVVALRIVASQLAVASLIALAVASWRSVRQRRPRASSAPRR